MQVSLACRTNEDTCKSDTECGPGGGQCVQPQHEPNVPWACKNRMCAIGRPLVIEGQTNAARATQRTDWNHSLELDLATLEPGLRGLAQKHYMEMAAMEHASVASFARFSLQLMALGAPADLLAEAHRAALDEIEHARVAYGLATFMGTTDVGPDKLPAALASIPTSIAEFVEALVEEGCVGETLGAAEVREAAEAAAFAPLADVLHKIAADEERHATLAWRSLQWAMCTYGDVAREAARRGLARAALTYANDPNSPEGAEMLGVLSGKTLGKSRRRVLSMVIEPCARQLGIEMAVVRSA